VLRGLMTGIDHDRSAVGRNRPDPDLGDESVFEGFQPEPGQATFPQNPSGAESLFSSRTVPAVSLILPGRVRDTVECVPAPPRRQQETVIGERTVGQRKPVLRRLNGAKLYFPRKSRAPSGGFAVMD